MAECKVTNLPVPNKKRRHEEVLLSVDVKEVYGRQGTRSIGVESLPETVLLTIFSSLRTVTDKCSVARTCLLWNRIIRDPVLWKEYTLHECNLEYKTVKSVLASGLGSSLLHLDLLESNGRYNSYLYGRKIWSSLTNLQKLRINNIDLCAFNFDLLPSSLKSLTIYTSDHIVKSSPARVQCSTPVLCNLEHLEIEDCEDVFANDEINELRGLSALLTSEKLQTVILKLMHYRFNHKSLSKMAQNMKHVKHITLHSHSICETGFKNFVSPFVDVEILNLQFANIEADMETLIVPSISGLKMLQEIYLSMFWELRPEHVKSIVKNLPNLRLLQIFRCRRINKEHLTEIESLKDGLKCQFPNYMRLSLM